MSSRPGLGVRVGVVSHHKGRRELVIYDAEDPDAVADVVALTAEEGDVLSELTYQLPTLLREGIAGGRRRERANVEAMTWAARPAA
jgi:hypothetical protein